jgi:thymidine kinase
MSLELIVGCMYSGKSSELVRRVKRIQSIHKNYIIYNSILDTRYGSRGIFTHNQGHLPCCVIDSLCSQLDTEEFKQADSIFIDEAQFFDDLYEFCELAVETHKKNVYVIGLDGDSERNNFGQIHKLLPLCDTIIKLKALCSQCNDGTLGLFSKKIINSSKQVDIGTTDKYIAVCRECYLK